MNNIWSWIVSTFNSPEFFAIALFCMIGLWLTFFFIHYFPDVDAITDPVELLHGLRHAP
jgi:hypothetical protein